MVRERERQLLNPKKAVWELAGLPILGKQCVPRDLLRLEKVNKVKKCWPLSHVE